MCASLPWLRLRRSPRRRRAGRARASRSRRSSARPRSGTPSAATSCIPPSSTATPNARGFSVPVREERTSTPSDCAQAACDQTESREIARGRAGGREIVAPVPQEQDLVRSGRRPVPQIEKQQAQPAPSTCFRGRAFSPTAVQTSTSGTVSRAEHGETVTARPRAKAAQGDGLDPGSRAAAFRPGRVVGLDLTREQKRELRDAEGANRARRPAASARRTRGRRSSRALPPHREGHPGLHAQARAQGRRSAAVGYGSGLAAGVPIGQLPPALQGLRRSLGLLRAPVQNPARDVLPQHRQASCRQSLRRQARTRASMVAAPPVRGLLGAPAARDYALTGAADGHSGRGIRDAWLAAARAPYPRTLVFGRLRSVTGSGGTVGEVERWHLLHRGQRDA